MRDAVQGANLSVLFTGYAQMRGVWEGIYVDFEFVVSFVCCRNIVLNVVSKISPQLFPRKRFPMVIRLTSTWMMMRILMRMMRI